MKTSIKIAALLVAIMGSTLASKAQTTKTSASNGIIYNVGVESGLALGSSEDLHKWSLGGSVGGLKYFPIALLYIQGEAGALFSLNKKDAGYTKSTAFLYTPTIGVMLPLSSGSFLDAGVQYEGCTKFNDFQSSKENMIGVHVAYAFSIK
jgi:hypothetical protein